MNYDPKSKHLKHFRIKEAWAVFFILGIIMLNYPFIHIFYKPRTLLFGVPILFLYLYLGWLISIVVVYLFVKAIDVNHKGEHR